MEIFYLPGDCPKYVKLWDVYSALLQLSAKGIEIMKYSLGQQKK